MLATAPLLDPGLLRRLETFQLLAARVARSALKGERRSRTRGQSIEFADHRHYVPGDDLRHLDWNLYGRLDRLFVKLHEEERELPVRIFLDASESMNFGEPSKFLVARRIAAAIGHVALYGFDRVSVFPFPDVDRPGEVPRRAALRSVRGRKSARAFLENLGALAASGTGDLNAALRGGAAGMRRAGTAVVVGDFLDPAGYEDGLAALLAAGCQVVAVQVLASEEWEPAAFGDLKVIDSESGAETEVTFGRYRLAAYRRTVADYVARLREHCVARGIRFFGVNTATPIDDLLLKEFRHARLWA
jgi:uncharacterized protein (DUF58 family)